MRNLLILLAFLSLPLCAATAEEPEIVIELTGIPDKPIPDGVNIWDKNAKTLTRLFNGKTREEALRLITSVSTKDVQVPAADGTKYRFVQYGHEGGYRKFLFRAQEPQTFVAVATTPQEVLFMFSRYKVNIGLSEAEFADIYPAQITQVSPIVNGSTLYKLQQGPTDRFFWFENKQLTRILTAEEVEKLRKEQQKAAAAAAANTKTPKTPPPVPDKPITALLRGGTLSDQMYMPRVIFPNETSGSSSKTTTGITRNSQQGNP